MVGNRSGSQDQSKVYKIQKARYDIGNVSMKDLAFCILNMRNCGKRKFRKHREIKGSDERVTYENM